MVGFSWVIYAGEWSFLGGTFGGVIGFASIGILCSFIGLAYGELTSMFPRAAGEVVFSFRSFGERLSWFTGWFMLAGYALVAFFEAVFFPFVLVQIGVPIPQVGALWSIGGVTIYASWILVSVIGVAIFSLLTHWGIRFSGTIQSIGVFVLIAIGITIAVTGLGLGSVGNAEPLITNWGGISEVIFLAPAFMLGFGTIPQVAEEMDIPYSTSGKLVPIAIWMAVGFYSLVILGIGFGAPAGARQGLGVSEAIASLTGTELMTRVVMTGALAGMLTSWNAFFVASSRVVYGLGRAKMLPGWFSKLHPDHKTPTNAIIVIAIISVFGTLLGYGVFDTMISILSFWIVVLWGIVFASFINLRRKEPNIDRPFKVPSYKIIGVLGAVSVGFFLLIYTPVNPSGGLPLLGWAVNIIYLLVAVVIFFGWFRRKKELSYEERYEKLVGSKQEF